MQSFRIELLLQIKTQIGNCRPVFHLQVLKPNTGLCQCQCRSTNILPPIATCLLQLFSQPKNPLLPLHDQLLNSQLFLQFESSGIKFQQGPGQFEMLLLKLQFYDPGLLLCVVHTEFPAAKIEQGVLGGKIERIFILGSAVGINGSADRNDTIIFVVDVNVFLSVAER